MLAKRAWIGWCAFGLVAAAGCGDDAPMTSTEMDAGSMSTSPEITVPEDTATTTPVNNGEATTGQTDSGDSWAAQTEQLNGTCPSDPMVLKGVTPAGTACTQAAECAPVCCNCDTAGRSWLTAVCLAGECAAQDMACSLTKNEERYCSDTATTPPLSGNCGNENQVCCPDQAELCGAGLRCSTGLCRPCGGENELCCPASGSECENDLECLGDRCSKKQQNPVCPTVTSCGACNAVDGCVWCDSLIDDAGYCAAEGSTACIEDSLCLLAF